MVVDMGWFAVPMTALVVFTLYGIDGIGSQLEDPFGYDRNDINMDAIVEDIRAEVLVLVDEWKRVDGNRNGIEWFMGKSTTGYGSMDVRSPAAKVVSFTDYE